MALASGFCVKDQMHFDNWSSLQLKTTGVHNTAIGN